MAIFAIADLHLSTMDSMDKSMEVFGHRWADYLNRIEANWKKLVTDEDTVVIPGDISWALSLEQTESDMRFLDSLPGKKILGKGNHDFWWCTMKKHEAFFERIGVSSVSFLFNNAHEVEDFIIAGTRGWYQDEGCENMPPLADFEKLVSREVGRLKMSLDEARKLRGDRDKEILVFLHFPIVWGGRECTPLLDVLTEYGIRRLFFGHIHSNYAQSRFLTVRNISMELISSDFLEFIPRIIRV